MRKPAPRKAKLPKRPVNDEDTPEEGTAMLFAAAAIGYANAMARAFPIIHAEDILERYANEIDELSASLPAPQRRILRRVVALLLETEADG